MHGCEPEPRLREFWVARQGHAFQRVHSHISHTDTALLPFRQEGEEISERSAPSDSGFIPQEISHDFF